MVGPYSTMKILNSGIVGTGSTGFLVGMMMFPELSGVTIEDVWPTLSSEILIMLHDLV